MMYLQWILSEEGLSIIDELIASHETTSPYHKYFERDDPAILAEILI